MVIGAALGLIIGAVVQALGASHRDR
jgi:hypothetical protein